MSASCFERITTLPVFKIQHSTSRGSNNLQGVVIHGLLQGKYFRHDLISPFFNLDVLLTYLYTHPCVIT
jgi:hypothetical protein